MRKSPWLHQIKSRETYSISTHNNPKQIAIVWGGIAGIMTAYMLLTHTSKSVTIVESNRIASGATWHNAWQVAAYFERPFDDIVAEFGLDMAVAWQEALISGRELLEEILAQENLDVPYEKWTWYVGISREEDLIAHLRRKHLRSEANLVFDSILVAEWKIIWEIPSELMEYVTIVPHDHILNLLQSKDPQYIAIGASTKWTINSALLCEELLSVLRKRYEDRLYVSELTHVKSIDVTTASPTVIFTINDRVYNETFEDVILCTNGYRNFNIVSHSSRIDKRIREWIHGVISYMVGITIDKPFITWCLSYFPKVLESSIQSATDLTAYFYLTIRNYMWRGLLSIWWPEMKHKDMEGKLEDHTISDKHFQDIHSFLDTTRIWWTNPKTEFSWNWLIGYTKNSIREIWQDPEKPHLRYNLWCNGVGICSSVYGAWKIMKLFQWESFPESIFDIKK